jgi:hypothetical protein
VALKDATLTKMLHRADGNVSYTYATTPTRCDAIRSDATRSDATQSLSLTHARTHSRAHTHARFKHTCGVRARTRRLQGKPLAIVESDGTITLNSNGQRHMPYMRALNELLAIHAQGISIVADKADAVRATPARTRPSASAAAAAALSRMRAHARARARASRRSCAALST